MICRARSVAGCLTLFVLSLFLAEFAPAQDSSVKRYVRFSVGDRVAYGLLQSPRVLELKGDLFSDPKPTDRIHNLSDVQLLVPVRPTKVLALAGNYKDHLGDNPLPEYPEPFYKPVSCLQHHGGNILLPTTTSDIHYEAELVIVIGKRARKVSVAEAMDHVFGITCGNDVSARIWQNDPDTKDVQWWRAKGYDTFGPVGPAIASGLDYGNLQMELRVNGEVRQKTNTRNQIHGIAETVSFVSQHITLEPGDLIFTGTPGKTQPLQDGDVVEVEIEGVGVLKNQAVTE